MTNLLWPFMVDEDFKQKAYINMVEHLDVGAHVFRGIGNGHRLFVEVAIIQDCPPSLVYHQQNNDVPRPRFAKEPVHKVITSGHNQMTMYFKQLLVKFVDDPKNYSYVESKTFHT
jgi:hypothetical protein